MRDYKEEKRKAMDKWKNLGNTSGTQSLYNTDDLKTFSSGNHLLPVAMRVSARTIGQDIVPVMSGSDNTDIINEVKSINRDRKIEALIDGTEYKEMRLNDHPDFKSGIELPVGKLYFFDTIYGVPQS